MAIVTLLSLPYEMIVHVLSFGGDVTFKKPKELHSTMMFVSNFQAICKGINRMQGLKDYFDQFWWNVYQNFFFINPEIITQLEVLKVKMIKKNQIKRKVLLHRYATLSFNKNNQSEIPSIGIGMVGDYGVGKSALTVSYTQNYFSPIYDPTISDDYRKRDNIGTIPVVLDIIDTGKLFLRSRSIWKLIAGSEEHSTALRDSYLIRARGYLMVCDLTNIKSLQSMRGNIEHLIQTKDDITFQIVFALNKYDLIENDSKRDEIIGNYTNEINKITKELGLTNIFIQCTSAKTGGNVSDIYLELGRRFLFNFTGQDLETLKAIIEWDINYSSDTNKKKCITM